MCCDSHSDLTKPNKVAALIIRQDTEALRSPGLAHSHISESGSHSFLTFQTASRVLLPQASISWPPPRRLQPELGEAVLVFPQNHTIDHVVKIHHFAKETDTGKLNVSPKVSIPTLPLAKTQVSFPVPKFGTFYSLLQHAMSEFGSDQIIEY